MYIRVCVYTHMCVCVYNLSVYHQEFYIQYNYPRKVKIKTCLDKQKLREYVSRKYDLQEILEFFKLK